MKSVIFSIATLAGVFAVSSANAEVRLVEGPEPVQTYTVCNHSALYSINDRATLIRRGGRILTDAGDTFTIGHDPDVFLQTKRLVRHSYRSLSASGSCE